jgi:hypothetical protein
MGPHFFAKVRSHLDADGDWLFRQAGMRDEGSGMKDDGAQLVERGAAAGGFPDELGMTDAE